MTYMILAHTYGCVGREYGINARAQYVGKYQSCMVSNIEWIQCTRVEYMYAGTVESIHARMIGVQTWVRIVRQIPVI